MFEKLGVRNNLIRLVKSNFSPYRIILICIVICYEFQYVSMKTIMQNSDIVLKDIFILLVIPLIVSLLILFINYLKDNIIRKRMSEEYYRDILNEITCTELTYIDDNNVELKKDIVATLLELKLKKKIKFENNKIIIVNRETYDLTDHEIYVLTQLLPAKRKYSSLIEEKDIFKKYVNLIKEKKKITNEFEEKIYKDLKETEIFENNGDMSVSYRYFFDNESVDNIPILVKLVKKNKIKKQKGRLVVLNRETYDLEENEKQLMKKIILMSYDDNSVNRLEKTYRVVKKVLAIFFGIILFYIVSGNMEIVTQGMMHIFMFSILPVLILFAYSNFLKKYGCLKDIIGIIAILVFVFLTSVASSFIGDIVEKYQKEIFVFLKYLFTGVTVINIGIESYIILNSKKLTKKGKEIKRKLCGLKMYLNDFSTMKSKNLNEIDLWDEYAIYSVILNENKKITREVWKIFKNTFVKE